MQHEKNMWFSVSNKANIIVSTLKVPQEFVNYLKKNCIPSTWSDIVLIK